MNYLVDLAFFALGAVVAGPLCYWLGLKKHDAVVVQASVKEQVQAVETADAQTNSVDAKDDALETRLPSETLQEQIADLEQTLKGEKP